MFDEPPNAVRAIIQELHLPHPRMRAKDWRSPLIFRLLGSKTYADGNQVVASSFRGPSGTLDDQLVNFVWSELKEDFEQCVNTYQDAVLTEYATLAIAAVLVQLRLNLPITEVCRRGERTDYYIGDREYLLEVSGRESGNIDSLCDVKATEQLQKNPMGMDGYVCVAVYDTPDTRLWFYAFPQSGAVQ